MNEPVVDEFDKAQSTAVKFTTAQNRTIACDIVVEGLTLCHDGASGATLLDETRLELKRGRRYGLVGRNGCGKTTLLRHLAEGRIQGIPAHLRRLFVDDASTVHGTDPKMTVLAFLLEQHKGRVALAAAIKAELEEEEECNVILLEQMHQQWANLNADATEARAKKVLSGLRLSADAQLGELSGGWRHIVALAAALFLEADVLILDEPTTHLDLRALIWLESFLCNDAAFSTIIVVSHDEVFLDSVTTDTIHIECQKLNYYRGSYFRFVETRLAKWNKHQRMFNAQEARRRRWEETIAKLSRRVATDPSVAGLISARKAALQRRLGASLDNVKWTYGLMGPRPEIFAPPSQEPFEFVIATDLSDLPESGGNGNSSLIELQSATMWYTPEHPTVLNASLKVIPSSRVALVGPNGGGKSTILRMLAGVVLPNRGSILRWEGLRVGYLEQDAAVRLTDELPALDWLARRHSSTPRQDLRNALGSFSLIGVIAEQRALKLLSAGERYRALLADLSLGKPHLLLLDEPSSHLDAETNAALMIAVQTFEGAVVMASHDQRFIEETATELYLVDVSVSPLRDLNAYCDAIRREAVELPLQASTEPRRPTAALPKVAAQDATTDSRFAEVQVKCRKCNGAHFTHSCPNQVQRPSKAADAATPKPAVAPRPKQSLPPRVEKASDGGGDWKVVVAKSTLRRLKKGA